MPLRQIWLALNRLVTYLKDSPFDRSSSGANELEKQFHVIEKYESRTGMGGSCFGKQPKQPSRRRVKASGGCRTDGLLLNK